MNVIHLNKHLKNNRDRMFEGRICANIKLKIITGKGIVNTDTQSLFKDKKILLFSSPGAFSLISTELQLPEFESNYDKLLSFGINEVFCVSVNDGHVMNAWITKLKIKKIKVLPDENANFTRSMGMLFEKSNIGNGLRSWRYCSIINNGVIEKWFQEDGMNNEGLDIDPYEQTTPQNCINYLESLNKI